MNLSRQFNTQAGFSLIEIAIVLGILALLLSLFAGMSTNLISQHRRELTRTRLANIDTALTLFVSQYKRLPCPADGKLPPSDPAAGKEFPQPIAQNCSPNNQKHGVVPWVALGLTASDIEDGWGGRFTYRVGPDLVLDNAMDFSSCDPAGGSSVPTITPPPVGSYCTPARTPVCGSSPSPCAPSTPNCELGTLSTQCTPPKIALAGAVGKGLLVEDAAGNVIMDPRVTPSTGAAYVVISHGAEGGGAYSDQGIVQGSSTVAGTMEAMNFPNREFQYLPLVPCLPPPACPPPPPSTSFLVDGAYNATVAAHFDDFVSRPNILTVATRAQLAPRTHNY